ncbi:MAG: glycosyltransferase family 2 protein, partial [Actinobacteria bacterium]|nr:glycosyltransferase family 2 protein [Actinomycetota bacterium]
MSAPSHSPFVGAGAGERQQDAGRAEDVTTGSMLLRQVELSAGFTDLLIPESSTGATYSAVQVLVRLHRRPLGIVRVPLYGARVLEAAMVAELVFDQLADEIEAHLTTDGVQGTGGVASAGILPTSQASCRHERTLGARPRTLVSVVVTTCNGRATLRACLQSILLSSYRPFEIIVVENRPGASTTAREIVETLPRAVPVRYVEERRRGLSNARNRGIAEARGEIVVFTDDDVLVD